MDRYRMFKSGKSGVYFQFDKQAKKQTSLHTKDRESAAWLLHATNEKEHISMVNRRILRDEIENPAPTPATFLVLIVLEWNRRALGAKQEIESALAEQRKDPQGRVIPGHRAGPFVRLQSGPRLRNQEVVINLNRQ